MICCRVTLNKLDLHTFNFNDIWGKYSRLLCTCCLVYFIPEHRKCYGLSRRTQTFYAKPAVFRDACKYWVQNLLPFLFLPNTVKLGVPKDSFLLLCLNVKKTVEEEIKWHRIFEKVMVRIKFGPKGEEKQYWVLSTESLTFPFSTKYCKVRST